MTCSMLPEGAVIRKVTIFYHSQFKNHLRGLIFYGAKDKILLEVGRHDTAHRTIGLAANERIVGVQSRTKEPKPAFRMDVQFMIAAIE